MNGKPDGLDSAAGLKAWLPEGEGKEHFFGNFTPAARLEMLAEIEKLRQYKPSPWHKRLRSSLRAAWLAFQEEWHCG
jgi:hypothetical protein